MGITKSNQTAIMTSQSIANSANAISSGYDVSDAITCAFDVFLDYSTNPTAGDVTAEVYEAQDGTNFTDEPVAQMVVSPLADHRFVLAMDCSGFKKLAVKVSNNSGQTATTTIKAIKTTL